MRDSLGAFCTHCDVVIEGQAGGPLVDFALGSDTGGSVRVPASYCGIYGMRPSHGRIPVDGLVPHVPSADTVGWFAREALGGHYIE